MCGFCGFTGDKENGETVLNNMMDKIIHRGPDSAGHYKTEQIALGFRRLSIIDLDTGTQPMFNETKDVVIVFNGEIYNHKDLREELLQKGHTFQNHSDTEVLIHAYEEYGKDMLCRLRGMFAFVLWDEKQNKLFCARDFFGIKPFYYTQVNQHLVFASEIKSILEFPGYEKAVNEQALENYLTFQYSVLPETFFKGIFKLAPAHCLTYQDGKLEVERYWRPDFKPNESPSLDEWVERIDQAMQDSIKAHKISDVEVGSFLSSGVDSSYVAACFKGKKTFSVGFDYEKYNEVDYAKSLCSQINLENANKIITKEEYWQAIGKVQYHMDEPLADPSAVALYFVSKKASEQVKVALSGEGADELFGGYNIYREPTSLKPITKLPKCIRKFLGNIAKAIPFSIKGKNFFIRASKDLQERFIGNAYMFSPEERETLLKAPSSKYLPEDLTRPYYNQVKQFDEVTQMQYIDIHFWLIGDILLKADKMSMANSLEVRVPFLDRVVFDVAREIPTAYKVNKTNTKYAMRMASHRHLPDAVAEKKKLGFPVPIRIWLKEDTYYQQVKTAFESNPAKEYFHTEKLIELLDEHRQGKKDNSRKIWTVYMFLVWYHEFFEAAAA